MDVWYKKLGYYENPFLINPMRETTQLYGNEVISSFKGRIIYVDAAALKKNLNIEELLRKKNGMKGKLFGKKPVDMILVLDNVTELSTVNVERIKYYYDQGFLQSVVMAGKTSKNLPASMLNRIGKRVVVLDELSKANALKMAYERLDEDIEDEEPLITTKHVETIFEKSKKNPRLFLINMHRVFEEMDFEDAKVVEDTQRR
jgi:hypothetical protein